MHMAPNGMDGSPRIAALPESFAATRASLYRVAEKIVTPARKPDNEIALQATPGGFGTPVFELVGAGDQVAAALAFFRTRKDALATIARGGN